MLAAQYEKDKYFADATHEKSSYVTLIWVWVPYRAPLLPNLAGKVNLILDLVDSLQLTSLKCFSQPGKNVLA